MMQKLEADVVVIGGGMSGLVAATSASQHDADVIVIEKGSTVGGAANMGMAMNVNERSSVGSVWQSVNVGWDLS